ncbi:hypothetical protein D3C85_1295240 [compost metagenome]
MIRAAEREDSLLGSRLFLIAAGAAYGHVKAMQVQRLLQGVGLHRLGMGRRTRGDRADPARQGLVIGVDQQPRAIEARHMVAVGDHVPKLPRRIHVQQRERRRARIEGLGRQVQQDAGILADRIHHDRVARRRRHLAQDLDRLGLKLAQMRGQDATRGGVSLLFDGRLHRLRSSLVVLNEGYLKRGGPVRVERYDLAPADRKTARSADEGAFQHIVAGFGV